MAAKIYLDVTAGIANFAKAHGAELEKETGRWFVYEPVPGPLEAFLPKKGRAPAPEVIPCCDVCGSSMTKRTRKYDSGYFWACSAYPVCRNTKPWNPNNQTPVTESASRAVMEALGIQDKSEPQPIKLQKLRNSLIGVIKEYLGEKGGVMWLNTPKVGLGRKKPLDLLSTIDGCQRVKDFFIEFLRENYGDYAAPDV